MQNNQVIPVLTNADALPHIIALNRAEEPVKQTNPISTSLSLAAQAMRRYRIVLGISEREIDIICYLERNMGAYVFRDNRTARALKKSEEALRLAVKAEQEGKHG